jgi:hypothetical protein
VSDFGKLYYIEDIVQKYVQDYCKKHNIAATNLFDPAFEIASNEYLKILAGEYDLEFNDTLRRLAAETIPAFQRSSRKPEPPGPKAISDLDKQFLVGRMNIMVEEGEAKSIHNAAHLLSTRYYTDHKASSLKSLYYRYLKRLAKSTPPNDRSAQEIDTDVIRFATSITRLIDAAMGISNIYLQKKL